MVRAIQLWVRGTNDQEKTEDRYKIPSSELGSHGFIIILKIKICSLGLKPTDHGIAFYS